MNLGDVAPITDVVLAARLHAEPPEGARLKDIGGTVH